MRGVYQLLLFLFLLLSLHSCVKNEVPENPFDTFTPSQDTVKFIFQDPDSVSIAGLYTYIFKPTCANVGCHDGTFEPDFRTMESSYNSLVYRKPIKDDGGYQYRVHPYQPDLSVIMARLTGKLLPYMPIQLEPDSDWDLKRDEYINLIRRWIQNGAPAIDGTIPGNASPRIRLMGAIAVGDTAMLERKPLGGPILLDTLTDSINLYFAFQHDQQNPITFTNNSISFSNDPHDFETDAIQMALELPAIKPFERGLYGEYVQFTHSVRISVKSLFPESDELYFRVYVKDQLNPLSEIPAEMAVFNLKKYMSFER